MSDYTDEKLAALEQQAQDLGAKGPLVPLLPPKPLPLSRTLPTLKLRSSSKAPFGPTKHTTWRVDTFIVPAAFPRSIKGSTQHPSSSSTSQSGAKVTGERIDPNKAFVELVDNQLAGLRSGKISVSDKKELDDQEQLFIAVNRYVDEAAAPRLNSSEPVLTLVFAHANGFHKETWEPTISDLLDQMGSTSRPIGEVWSLDAVNQGDSAVLNEAVLGNTFDWADHGRDILNFIISYLPDPSSPNPTSTYLPYIPTVNQNLQQLDAFPLSPGRSHACCRTFRNRLIVGIGHSLGGGGMAFAASGSPSLFSSIILCDPVVPTPSSKRLLFPITKGALVRREKWTSRQEAKDGFLKRPFFRMWDPRTLDLYIELGTKDLPDGGIALKARAKDEALVFGDLTAVSARRASGRLSLIPSTLPFHFVFADKDRSVLGEQVISDLLRLIPSATHERVEGAGHLVAQEKPTVTAARLADQLKKVYPLKSTAVSKL